MDLNFCDICNESVPLADLSGGSARKIGERVICTSCESAMSHDELEGSLSGGAPVLDGAEPGVDGSAPSRAPAPVSGPFAAPPFASDPVATPPSLSVPAGAFSPPTESRGFRGGIFLIGLIAVASLVVTSVVTIELVDRITSLQVETRKDRARFANLLDSSQRNLAARVDDLDREQSASLSAGIDTIRVGQRSQAAKVEKKLKQIETKLAELSTLGGRLANLENQSREGQARVTRLSADLSQLNREVNKLMERWMEAIETGDVVTAADSEAAVDEVPEWMEHATRLSSPSAATRWNAVTALGDAKDEAVVPYLVGMLKDPDTFVRIATARILEDLGSLEAVPNLIEALTDTEVVVREVVITALRKITGENHRFDPAAPEAERSRRVKAWREWWKKNGV